ncbi:MAG: MotE family protein [Thermodesulfobacteriota bacterium]
MTEGKKIQFFCCLLPAAVLIVFLSGQAGAAEEAPAAEQKQVVFECEDIGVEARRLLSDIKKERRRFKEKKQQLDQREKELKIFEEQVDEKLERLKTLEKELDKKQARNKEVEAEKVKKLSKIYQKRDPAGAAATLAAMDQQLAVAVLEKMRDKYAGDILDNMAPEVAVQYSTALGRLDGGSGQ